MGHKLNALEPLRVDFKNHVFNLRKSNAVKLKRNFM